MPEKKTETPDNQPEGAQPTPDAATSASEPGAQPRGAFIIANWKSYALILLAMGVILIVTAGLTQSVFISRARYLTRPFQMAPPPPGSTSNSVSNSVPVSDAPQPVEDYKTPPQCKIPGHEEQGNFILRKRQQMVAYGDGHLDAAIKFGAYFYSTVAILAIFGFISLISLALITKAGLANSHGIVVAIFLLSTGIGLVYQGFFGVFNQKTNIDANSALSVDYGKLVDEVDTYCSTGKISISDPGAILIEMAKAADKSPGSMKVGTNTNADPAKTKVPGESTSQSAKPTHFYTAVDPDTFILYLDWQMKKLRRFAIILDDKQVSSFTDTTRMPGL